MGSCVTVFSPLQKEKLVDYLKEQEARLYGFSCKELCTFVWQMAEKNRIAHPFEKSRAGRSWIRGFFDRYSSLSLRKPEAVSSARDNRFNSIVVSNYFSMYQEQLALLNFQPDRIFNVDETGVSVVSKTVAKIIASRGKKQVGVRTAGERRRTITFECCVSAFGQRLPPVFIFPRKRLNPKLLDGVTKGSWAMVSDSS